MIQNIYSPPLAPHILLRALDEKRTIRSICRKEKKENIVIRATDKSHLLHVGRACDYERKALEYTRKTSAYEVIHELNQTSTTIGISAEQKILNDIVERVDSTLHNLLQHKRITSTQFNAMRVDRTKVELGHLYFVPKPHKVEFLFCIVLKC